MPMGVSGEQADALAMKMLSALDYPAFENTDYIEWTHQRKRHYRWYKNKHNVNVHWKEYRVNLNLKNPDNHKAYVHGFIIDGDMADELIEKAVNYFNKDSFWLVAPYKIFDEGTKRQLVSNQNNENALLVTYNSNHSYAGDSYLWLLDSSGKPEALKMWTSKLPIDGIKSSWSDWKTTESGAQLPTFHKVLFFGFEIDEIETTR